MSLFVGKEKVELKILNMTAALWWFMQCCFQLWGENNVIFIKEYNFSFINWLRYTVKVKTAIGRHQQLLRFVEKWYFDDLWRKTTSFGIRSHSILMSFLINCMTLNKLLVFSGFYFVLLTIMWNRLTTVI